MTALRIILSMVLFLILTSTGESCRNVYSQSGYALVDHAYKSFFTGRLASCYMSCNTQPTCQSLNYNLADKTCELNNDTKYFLPTFFAKKPEFDYAENPDSGKLRSTCFLSTKYAWTYINFLCSLSLVSVNSNLSYRYNYLNTRLF